MKTTFEGQLGPVLDRLIHFRDSFDRELEQEIMRGERLRSRFLLGVFLALGLAAVAANLWFSGLVAQVFHGGFSLVPVIILLLAYAGYELFFQLAVGVFLRRGLKFPPFPKYANALIETSFPTIAIYALLAVFPAGTALALPPVFAYFLFISLSALRLEPKLSLFTGLVAAAGYLGLVLWSLPGPAAAGRETAWWAELAPCLSRAGMIMAAGVIAAFVAGQIRGRLVAVIRSREERNLIAGVFGQHVSPAVMDRLLHQPEGLDSETREVCVMFLDIRDFTAYSHSRAPDEVVRHLNSLFGFMIELVNDNHGLINKFLGDGFMAVFGAPLPDGEACLNAIRASLAISGRLREEAAAGRVEATRIGIGLHSGQAVTGNVGSALRKEYTVIGDVVNLASRLEQLNKQFGSEILVSAETWAAAAAGRAKLPPPHESLDAVDLGEVQVKGRNAAVRVFRLR